MSKKRAQKKSALTSFPAPTGGNLRLLSQYERQHQLVRWAPPPQKGKRGAAGNSSASSSSSSSSAPNNDASAVQAGAAATPADFNYFYGNTQDPNAPANGDEETLPASWMPNDKCLVCYECGAVFTMFRRKHHCRLCGHIVCGNCSTKNIDMRLVYPHNEHGYARACDFCYSYFVEQNPDLLLPITDVGGSSGAKGAGTGVASKGSSAAGGGGVDGQTTTADDELDSIIAFARSEADRLRRAEVGPAAGLAALISSEGGGDESRRDRLSRLRMEHKRIRLAAWALHRCQSYENYLEALQHQVDFAIFDDRTGGPSLFGTPIPTPMVAGASEDSTRFETTAVGSDTIPEAEVGALNATTESQAVISSAPAAKAGSGGSGANATVEAQEQDDEERGSVVVASGQVEQAAPNGAGDSGPAGSSEHIPRSSLHTVVLEAAQSAEGSRSREWVAATKQFGAKDQVASASEDMANNATVPVGARIKRALPHLGTLAVMDLLADTTAHQSLDRRAEEMTAKNELLTRNLVRHLLSQATQLSDSEKALWLSVLCDLTEKTVSAVSPDASREDFMDVLKYVHVKVIKSSEPTASEVVRGLVFRKNVAHRTMMQPIDRPRVLLVDGGIEYHRKHEFTRLQTYFQQQADYIDRLVVKIQNLKPDIMLVTKNVCCRAQVHLLHDNVTQVLNVKPSVMRRLSRVTGARIVNCVDHLDKIPPSEVIGTQCQSFRLSYFDLEPVRTAQQAGECNSFMVFENCPGKKGVTVVLRGSCLSRDTGKVLKRILRASIRYLHHQRRCEALFRASLGELRFVDSSGSESAAPSALLQRSPRHSLASSGLDANVEAALSIEDIPTENDSAAAATTDGESVADLMVKTREWDWCIRASEHVFSYAALVLDANRSAVRAQITQAEEVAVQFYSKEDTTLGLWVANCCELSTSHAPQHQLRYQKPGLVANSFHQGLPPAIREASKNLSTPFGYHRSIVKGQNRIHVVVSDMVVRSALLKTATDKNAAQNRAQQTHSALATTAAEGDGGDGGGSKPADLGLQSLNPSAREATSISGGKGAKGPEVYMWLWSRVSQRQVTGPTKLSLEALGLSFAKFLEVLFDSESFKQFVWFFAVPTSSFNTYESGMDASRCPVVRFEVESIVLYDIVTCDLNAPAAADAHGSLNLVSFLQHDLDDLSKENERLYNFARHKCKMLKNAWEEKLWAFTHEEQLARSQINTAFAEQDQQATGLSSAPSLRGSENTTPSKSAQSTPATRSVSVDHRNGIPTLVLGDAAMSSSGSTSVDESLLTATCGAVTSKFEASTLADRAASIETTLEGSSRSVSGQAGEGGLADQNNGVDAERTASDETWRARSRSSSASTVSVGEPNEGPEDLGAESVALKQVLQVDTAPKTVSLEESAMVTPAAYYALHLSQVYSEVQQRIQAAHDTVYDMIADCRADQNLLQLDVNLVWRKLYQTATRLHQTLVWFTDTIESHFMRSGPSNDVHRQVSTTNIAGVQALSRNSADMSAATGHRTGSVDSASVLSAASSVAPTPRNALDQLGVDRSVSGDRSAPASRLPSGGVADAIRHAESTRSAPGDVLLTPAVRSPASGGNSDGPSFPRAVSGDLGNTISASRPSTADATLGHGRASMASFGNWLKMQLQDGSTASGSMACRSTSDSILEANKIARGRMPFAFGPVLQNGCPSLASGVNGLCALIRGDFTGTRRKRPHVNGVIAYTLLMHRFQQAQAIRVDAVLGHSRALVDNDGTKTRLASTVAADPAAIKVALDGVGQLASDAGDEARQAASSPVRRNMIKSLTITEKPSGFTPPASAPELDMTERFKGSVRRARDDLEANRVEIHPTLGGFVKSTRLTKQRGYPVWFHLAHRAAIPSRAGEIFTPGRKGKMHHTLLRLLMTSSMLSERPDEPSEAGADKVTTDRGLANSDHIEISFSDASSGDSFFVTAYFAVQFAALRTLYLGSNDMHFINSMCTSVNWNATGGKSGATFLKTLDQKFIVKDISTTERDSFKANGHYYFAHLAQCLAGRTNDRAGVSEPNDHASGSTDDAFAKTDSVARNRTRGASLSSFQDTLGSSAGSVLSGAFPTVLVKILGLFTVTLENGARSKTKTVIVMENLLYGKRGDLKTFDLKGTFGSKRLVGEQDEVEVDIRSPVDQDASKVPRESDGISAESAEAGEADGTTQASDVVSPPIPTIVDAESGEKKNMVLLDNNFMQYTAGFPVPLLPKAKEALGMAVRRDTQFLSHDCEKPVMDYSILVAIDQVKHEISVGIIDYMRHYDLLKFFESHGKRMLQGSATVLHPEKYKERFLHRLESYFMSSPDDTLAHVGAQL